MASVPTRQLVKAIQAFDYQLIINKNCSGFCFRKLPGEDAVPRGRSGSTSQGNEKPEVSIQTHKALK